MKIVRRLGGAVARVVLHDKEVVRAEKGLIALAVVRILVAAGASAGLVEGAQAGLHMLGF